MKELLMPLFGGIPFFIEYLTAAEEEAEIDLTQARKCCDFKRMMLSSVPQGGGVGIPVPLGYDDILVCDLTFAFVFHEMAHHFKCCRDVVAGVMHSAVSGY